MQVLAHCSPSSLRCARSTVNPVGSSNGSALDPGASMPVQCCNCSCSIVSEEHDEQCHDSMLSIKPHDQDGMQLAKVCWLICNYSSVNTVRTWGTTDARW